MQIPTPNLHNARTPEGNAAARRTLYLDGFKAGFAGHGAECFDDPDFFEGYRNGNTARMEVEDAAYKEFGVMRPEPPTGAHYTPWSLADALISDAGGVKVYQGDALRVLQHLPPFSVDCVIADPPYSSGGMFKGDRMASTGKKYVQSGQKLEYLDFNGDNRDQRAYLIWSTLWMSEALRISKPSSLMLCFTDWRQIATTIDAIQCGGWIYRGIMPWNKTEAARPRKGAPRNQCEYIVWGSNGAMADEGECFPGLHTFSVGGSEKTHIAGKPDKLMQELVRLCPSGGIICDPFSGSGTTVKAAKAMGYEGWAIEINEHWAGETRDRAASELHLPAATPPETPHPELFP